MRAEELIGCLNCYRVTLLPSSQGAHRKLLDLTSTLGLSNTVMRLIEKRTQQVSRYLIHLEKI